MTGKADGWKGRAGSLNLSERDGWERRIGSFKAF